MNDEIRRRLGSDGLGYGSGGVFNRYNHASICECERCQNEYDKHNRDKWCACHPCQMHNLNRNNPYQSDEKGNTKMATINLCERCESMGKSDVMGYIEYRTDPRQGLTTVEICPGCVEDFMQFLNGDVAMEGRQKAYKEPWKPEADNTTSGEILTPTVRSALRAILAEAAAEDGNTES